MGIGIQDLFSSTLIPAQTGGAKPKGGEPVQVVIWVGILIVAVLVGWIVVTLVRKKMLGSSENAAGESLFANLRRMRAAGEISDSEYEAARKALAARIAGKKETTAKVDEAAPKPRPRPEPPKPGTDMRAPPGYDLTGAAP